MKEANNNAIDLLLRSLARGGDPRSGADAVSPVGTDSSIGSSHLDADELNLYAEGVLAPPARIRYTAHLADCQRCRTLVVGLAQAAGRTVQHETKKPGGASFWASLSALFSIPVLRYAIPAVLLTGLISIGLLALRDRANTDLVAVNQKTDLAAPNVESSLNSATPPTDGGSTLQEKLRTDGSSPSNEPNKNAPAESGLLTEKATSNPVTVDGTAGQDAAKTSTLAGAGAAQPIYAPDVASAPAPPPKGAGESEKFMARKDEDQERDMAKRNQDELKLSSKDDSPTHGPSRGRTMSSARRRAEDVSVATENRQSVSNDKKESAEETETLTISGRNFRRRGTAWIDTAYNSSRTLTNVGRGTEQFRALMADEPGLRSIVQRLGGEVIVVWKNRAYRIR